MQDVMVSCKKCGNKAPASSLKLDLDLKMVVCSDCIKNKKIHKEIEDEVFHKENLSIKPLNNQAQVHQSNQIQEPKSSKVGHKCTSCGYKFMINIDPKTPKNCPYCNSRVMSF